MEIKLYKAMALWIYVSCFLYTVSMVTASDPCDKPVDISDVRRSVNNDQLTGSYLCDMYRILSGSWYSLEHALGDRMAETCPPDYYCGTIATMYLNGTHPTVENPGPITVGVSLSLYGDCHTWTGSIQVKLCMNSSTEKFLSYVYQLTPPPYCEAAYCTENVRQDVPSTVVPGDLSTSVPGDNATSTSSTFPQWSPKITTGNQDILSTTPERPEQETITTRTTHINTIGATSSISDATSKITPPSSSHRSSSTDSTIKENTSPVVSDDDPQTGDENRDAGNNAGQTTLIIGILVAMICVLVFVVIVGVVMWCRKTKKPQTGHDEVHKKTEAPDICLSVIHNDYLTPQTNYPKTQYESVYHYIDDNQYESIKDDTNTKTEDRAYQTMAPLEGRKQVDGTMYESLKPPASEHDLHVYKTMESPENLKF